MSGSGRWKLTMDRDVVVREIIVNSTNTAAQPGASGGASNRITLVNTTTMSDNVDGWRIERLSDDAEEVELQRGLEESGGGTNSSQLVCSGKYSAERKMSN